MNASRILADLSQRWEQLEADKGENLPRACTLTLVATAASKEDALNVRQTIGVLTHSHPCRAIVLRGEAGAETSAEVFAECWMPFGHHEQICSEGIEIIADPLDFAGVSGLIAGLRAADLPTVLWSREPVGAASVEALFPQADKLIFDTATALSPQQAIAYLRLLAKQGLRVADLHWARVTPWREAVSTLYEAKPFQVHSARIVHTESGASPGTLYVRAWLQSALPEVRILVESCAEPGPARVQSITFETNLGELQVKREQGRLAVITPERRYTVRFPRQTVEELLDQELRVTGDDEVFQRVLG